VDLYKHGEGELFQVPADALIILVQRGLVVSQANAAHLHDTGENAAPDIELAARARQLLAWLGKG